MATTDPLETFQELQDNDDQGATSLADEALGEIAKTGRVHHTWNILKAVLIFKLKKNLKHAFQELGPSESENVDQHRELLQRLSGFSNPPFTIQRLCELLAFPCKHYSRTDKYLRALERVLMVVTYVEPELCGEHRVPPLTSVPTEELIGGGGESGECTGPGGELEDSRGERKRELAMVELQEADSTVEGAEDEAPTKKAKWEHEHTEHSAHSPPTGQDTRDRGLTPEDTSTAVLQGDRSMSTIEGDGSMATQEGGSMTTLPGGGSTAALGARSVTALQGGVSMTALQGGVTQEDECPTEQEAMETSDGSVSLCEAAHHQDGSAPQESKSQCEVEGPAGVAQTDEGPDAD